MAFRTQKISQMTPKGSNLEGSDLLEVSTLEGGSYVTRSITGQEIIDAASGSGVTSVTGTAPIASTGGSTPDISISQAGAAEDGYLTQGDWNAFNNKQDALSSGVNIKTIEGQSLLGSGDINLTASDVGLGNVDNTSDLNKPISTATQTALNAKQNTLTLTTTGTSGAATLVGSTLNIPQYSGGGSSPIIVAINSASGTPVTGTTAETLSRSLLIPANTFGITGVMEIFARWQKTGTLGTQTLRMYVNTSNTLTGATLIANIVSTSTNTFCHGMRTAKVNLNTLNMMTTSTNSQTDLGAFLNTTIPFNTSVDQYIIFTVILSNATDSSVVEWAKVTKYA